MLLRQRPGCGSTRSSRSRSPISRSDTRLVSPARERMSSSSSGGQNWMAPGQSPSHSRQQAEGVIAVGAELVRPSLPGRLVLGEKPFQERAQRLAGVGRLADRQPRRDRDCPGRQVGRVIAKRRIGVSRGALDYTDDRTVKDDAQRLGHRDDLCARAARTASSPAERCTGLIASDRSRAARTEDLLQLSVPVAGLETGQPRARDTCFVSKSLLTHPRSRRAPRIVAPNFCQSVTFTSTKLTSQVVCVRRQYDIVCVRRQYCVSAFVDSMCAVQKCALTAVWHAPSTPHRWTLRDRSLNGPPPRPPVGKASSLFRLGCPGSARRVHPARWCTILLSVVMMGCRCTLGAVGSPPCSLDRQRSSMSSAGPGGHPGTPTVYRAVRRSERRSQ